MDLVRGRETCLCVPIAIVSLISLVRAARLDVPIRVVIMISIHGMTRFGRTIWRRQSTRRLPALVVVNTIVIVVKTMVLVIFILLFLLLVLQSMFHCTLLRVYRMKLPT